MIETSRRSFITGLVSLVAAPAIVKVANIMPVKVMPDETILARAMREYVERMINPALKDAFADFVLCGTGAMEFDGEVVRHVPLQQLHVDRLDVIKIMGTFPGLEPRS